MRTWQWLAVGLAILALAALLYPLFLTQNRLKQTHLELAKANEQIVQARAANSELERVITNLKTELDLAHKTRSQAKVEESAKQIFELRNTAGSASAELQQLTADRDAAISQLQSVKADLDKANAEVERLKTELQEKNVLPYQNGDSTFPPPVE